MLKSFNGSRLLKCVKAQRSQAPESWVPGGVTRRDPSQSSGIPENPATGKWRVWGPDCRTGHSVSVQDFECRSHHNEPQLLYCAFYLQPYKNLNKEVGMVFSLTCRETESLLMEITWPKSTESEIERGIKFRPSEFLSGVTAAQQPSFS